MERAIRQTVVIGPEGRFEGRLSGVAPGTTAEIIVLFAAGEEAVEPVREEPLEDAASTEWERHWAISDRLIAEGMETWAIDRVNAEIAARRGGEREVL